MKLFSNNSVWKDHLHIHFIVLLYGFTGILGKLISVNATELVSYRMSIAALSIGLYAWWKKVDFRLPPRVFLQVVGVGAIVAVHWITFFGAIKVSNVSVALGCMASATLFTSILEPLIEKRRVSWLEIFIGLIIIIGLYIITQFAFNYYWGIILALVSAFLASLFGVLNRILVQKYNHYSISFYEMLSGFVLILLYTFFTPEATFAPLSLSASDFGYLLILACFCTAYAFVATIYITKRLTAFDVALAINMEPVYAIILAFWMFGESERMDIGFYIGAFIIIASVFSYPILQKK
ncbi:MAG: DMT family transporter [Chitinophagales bacterium]